MSIWLEVARWGAGAILILSGILKLGRGRALHESLGTLGFSARFIHRRWTRAVLVPAVPVGEIVAGLGSLVVPTRLFAIAVFAAYLAFLAIIVRAIAVGRGATCDCFGGYGDARVGTRTVVRNSVLVVLAAVGMLTARAPALAWGAQHVALGVAAVLVPVTVAIAMVLMRPRALRRHARRLARHLRLHDVDGRSIVLAEFAVPATYLVFFSVSCLSCRRMVERFRWWPDAAAEGFDVQPVLLGAPDVFADIAEYASLTPFAWYDHDRSVARAVGLNGTPGVVLIDEHHPLGDGWVRGSRDAERYVVRDGFYNELQAVADAAQKTDES